MLNRQKVLLKVIEKLESKRINSRRAIVKSLFLLNKEYFLNDKIRFYSFYPYKQGPFSQMCYFDLRKLKNEGLIDVNETAVMEKGSKLIENQYPYFNSEINHLCGRFNTERELTKYVYSKYDEFTVRSELLDGKKMNKKYIGFNTIGYEHKNIDEFLNILIQNNVNILIDVRHNPFSMNFQFIREKLKGYLESVDIKYVHIPELGIESHKRKNLETKEDYAKLFLEYKKDIEGKREYLEKVIQLGKKNNIALMCFEKDPSFCHRGIIADYLRKNGHVVVDL